MVKLSKEDLAYISHANKQTKFSIEPEHNHISVPIGMEEEAKEDLTVQHIINKYGFKIQLSLDAQIKNVFDPKLSSAQAATPVNEAPLLRLPIRGEIWIRDGARWYFKSATEKQFVITHLHTLKGDSTLSFSSVESLVKSGLLKPE